MNDDNELPVFHRDAPIAPQLFLYAVIMGAVTLMYVAIWGGLECFIN